MRLSIVSLLLLCCLSVCAQEQGSWEQVWHEIYDAENTDDDAASDDYERLQQLAEHPINLNNTNRQELEQLPFL